MIESPDEVALDVALRLEQDPVAVLKVAVILLHTVVTAASGARPGPLLAKSAPAIRNAHEAGRYALRQLGQN